MLEWKRQEMSMYLATSTAISELTLSLGRVKLLPFMGEGCLWDRSLPPFLVPSSFCSVRQESSVCHMTCPATPPTPPGSQLLSGAMDDVVPCQSRSSFWHWPDYQQQVKERHISRAALLCLVPFHSSRSTATSAELGKTYPAEHEK